MNIFGINAIQIENESDKSKYYGKNVIGYTPQNGSTVGWKIFFADKNNIYLIADDYVEPNKLPASIKEDGTITQNTPKITGSSFTRSASFANIISDYSTGAKRIKNNYPIEIQQLNKSYFDQGFTSENANMKAIAYMLDTKAWSSFKDREGKASYVIGGPTIEILFKSYNQKYKVQYKAEAVKSIINNSINADGYQISKDNGNTWSHRYAEMLDKKDTLYVLPSSRGANAMWVASPSKNGDINVMYVYYDGFVDSGSYLWGDLGFRPVVCLNSYVELQKKDTGFCIKE